MFENMNQDSFQVVGESLLVCSIILIGLFFTGLIRLLLGKKHTNESFTKMLLRRLAFPLSQFILAALVIDRGSAVLNLLSPGTTFTFISLRITAYLAFWGVISIIRTLETAAVSMYRRKGQEFPLPGILHSVILGVFYAAALLGILSLVMNVDISPALGASALMTAILGFALQGVLGNLMAGVSINLNRTVEKGDWIILGDIEGRVVDTNWRETRLITIDGDRIAIPNSTLASQSIQNYSKPERLHRHRVDVGASYHDKPADVIAAMEEAARETPNVETKPGPWATVSFFNDFSVNYTLRFWTKRYWDRIRIDGHVQRLIWYKFQRAGIEIPFPMSDVLLNDWMAVVQGQKRKEPTEEKLDQLVLDLKRSRFLKPPDDPDGCYFTDEQLRRLAWHVKREVYTAGETLCRQGDQGENCYLVVRGGIRGSVQFTESSNRQAFEFQLGPGDVFGEMSLFTGAPRTASGFFDMDCEVLRIDGDTFAGMLAMNDVFTAHVEAIVSRRAEEQKGFLEHLLAVDAEELRRKMSGRGLAGRLRALIARGRRMLGVDDEVTPGEVVIES
ncbi:mechanosensitive ion channel family protein [bacterium]|nr:mechanosensitive ion channel family protein [candidate division CSSED10-310 bacterium]